MGFTVVYDMTIINEHTFLVIFGSRTNFWVGWVIFANFWVQDQFFSGAGSGCDKSKFILTLGNLLSMTFPMAYETTILNEQPFLVILGPWNKYWVGSGKFGLKTLP